MEYSIVLHQDDNGTFLVEFPDFEDAVTFGTTEAEAKRYAAQALAEVIAARMAHRLPIPAPQRREGHLSVALLPMVAAKLQLYWGMQQQGLRKADMARLLGCNQKQVDRILDARHQSTLGQLTRAFAALGKQLSLQVSDIPA
jgi:antitoxin HicB